MANIIITPDLLKKLNINKYDFFEYDTDYDKFQLKDYESISLIIREKIKKEIEEIDKREIEKKKIFEELRQKKSNITS
jgi:hypothetical protein